MTEKVLFVDDEPVLLQGYQRLLRNDFQVTTAVGGAAALTMVEHMGPFAVVLSDMRMPGMDGIEFLRRVKSLAPDTVRIMLSGVAELQTAIDAVNEGNIFRFLTKPSNKNLLSKTLGEAVDQHRLICAERELLEKTLRSTVYVLSEVLSVVSPAAFSRAMRVRRYVQQAVAHLKLASPWKYEVAAMMSQLGCVTLDPETIEKVYTGAELSPDEQARYLNHPRVARELLKNIPRMEPIAAMIARQQDGALTASDSKDFADIRLGTLIIRAALNFDALLRKGQSRVEAAHYLSKTCPELDRGAIEAMMKVEPEAAGAGASKLPIAELASGMILNQDLRSGAGELIAAHGQEVTSLLLSKLQSYLAKGAITGEVAALQPAAQAQ